MLTNLAVGLAITADWKGALGAMDEAATLYNEAGNLLGVAMAMEVIAGMSAWIGEADRAARLFGFAEVTKARLGGSPPTFIISSDKFRAKAVDRIGEAEYARAAAEGAELSVDDAMAMARAPMPLDAPPWPGVGI